MNSNQAELSLREVLRAAEPLKQYGVSAELEEEEFAVQYNVKKVNYVIDGMGVSLERFVKTMTDLEMQQRNTGLMEYFEERMGIENSTKQMGALEMLISRLLGVLDMEHQIDIGRLLDKLENISDTILQAKEHLIRYKSKLDISIIYHEICYIIISSLNQEISDCLDIYHRLSNLKLSSPSRHLQHLELDQIVAKMKINDLSYTNNMSMKSMRLPTFNDQDEDIYREYMSLDSRIKPLRISLEIVPLKIEEFNMICGNHFPYAIESVEEKYGQMLDEWSLLQSNIKKLKKDTIDTKWNEIFIYLIKEIRIKCQEVINSTNGITDEIGEKLKLCSNSVTLINKAFSDRIIHEREILDLYNNDLLPEWEKVSSLLTEPSSISENGSNEQIPLVLPKAKPSNDAKGLLLGKGLGIDLGIGVENINVPFSIEKKNRIKLWRNSELAHEKKDLKQKFLSFQEKNCEDDEITLVNKTPRLNIGILKLEDTKGGSSRNIDELWLILSRENSRVPSRIPLISSSYLAMELPVIKKKHYKSSPHSRIPEISPDHPVFNSPDRLQRQRMGPPELIAEKPMLKFPNRPSSSSRNYAIVTKPNGSPVNLKDSALYLRPSSSLNAFTTPDLKFT